MDTISIIQFLKVCLMTMYFASVVVGYQKKVNIDTECTDGQQYEIGQGDNLYIHATGDLFISSACSISLIAKDKRYVCSKICLSIHSLFLRSPDLELKVFDSGVWNFRTADPGLKRTYQNTASGDWCSTGPSATIELRNIRGESGSTVGKYGMEVKVVAKCSEEQPNAMAVEDDGTLGLKWTLIIAVILIGVILGLVAIIITLVMVYRKHQHAHSQAFSTRLIHNHRSSSQGAVRSLYPVQESCAVLENVDEDCQDALLSVKNQRNEDMDLPFTRQEPTAPPIEGDRYSEERPPSYCSVPPMYDVDGEEVWQGEQLSDDNNDRSENMSGDESDHSRRDGHV